MGTADEAFLATCPSSLKQNLTKALTAYSALGERLAVLEKWGFADPACRLATFAIVADTGVIGEETARDEVAAMVEDWEPDAVLHLGDVRYEDTPTVDEALDAALSPYNWAIEKEIFFAVPGNHDRSNDIGAAKLMSRMPYIYTSGAVPNLQTFYNVMWEKPDVEVFFLDSGVKTDGSQVEPRLFPPWPDGTPGSDQYYWLLEALKVSRAKWKFAVCHHPFVTIEGPLAVYPKFVFNVDLHYPELGMDMLLNGHSHANAHFNQRGVQILTVGSSEMRAVDLDGAPTGSMDDVLTNDVPATIWWDKSNTDRGRPSAIKVTVRPFDIILEYIEAGTLSVSHTAIITKRHGQLRI